jgi:hypothetical protein
LRRDQRKRRARAVQRRRIETRFARTRDVGGDARAQPDAPREHTRFMRRRRRAEHDDERRRHGRLNEEFERAIARARHRMRFDFRFGHGRFVADPHASRLPGAHRLPRRVDHDRLRAASADPAVQHAVAIDQRLCADLCRRGRRGADHRDDGERRARRDQLLLELQQVGSVGSHLDRFGIHCSAPRI